MEQHRLGESSDRTGHFLNDLRDSLCRHSGRRALEHQGRAYSYADLERLVEKAAARLQHHGLAPGDRVALWTGAKFPFLIAHLAILHAGGVSLPLNPKLPLAELPYFLTDSAARLIIAGADQVGLVEQVPGVGRVLADAELLQSAPSALRRIDTQPSDACLLIYSSGTTGWPKGVIHSQANLAASLHALAACWRFTAEDVVVNVLPLFHIHGLSFATQLPLLVGAAVLLEDTFHPTQTLEAIGRGTVFMGVPTIYYRFLQESAFSEAAPNWRTRLFTCGSAPIRPEVLPRLEAILGRPVINRYGMTEAHVITSLPLDGPWPQGSVGLPLAGVEVRVQAAPGEVGAVLVRGPNLFQGYWGKPEATQKAFASGWFETGDLGFLDAQGFLTLVGRSNDLIITNGFNVYPQVVERVLNECPGVRESAVVGVPDEMHGERVVAWVVSDGQVDETRLRAWCETRLVDYQRPRRFCFTDALPRNAMGKVLLADLRGRG